MYEDIYQNLSASLAYAISPFVELQAKLASDAISSITESLQKSFYNIAECCNQNIAMDFANQISALANTMVSAVEIPSVSLPDINFLKGISFQEEYIELTEGDCDSINALLESSDTANDVPIKIPKGKISIPDFIKSVLLPILIALIQMLHTSYYNKLDALESQKAYIEERQFQDEEIKLLKEQVHLQEQEIQAITHYAESLEDKLNELIDYAEIQEQLQEIPESDSEFSNAPEFLDEAPESLGEVPGSLDEAPDYSDATADESDNQ